MFDAAAEARRADTSCGICDPVTPYDQLSPLFTVVTTPLVPTLFADGAIQLPGNIVLAQRHEMNVELAAANCVENNVTQTYKKPLNCLAHLFLSNVKASEN